MFVGLITWGVGRLLLGLLRIRDASARRMLFVSVVFLGL
jgi:hypothetical protein